MLIPRASVGRTGDSLQPSQRAVGEPGEFGQIGLMKGGDSPRV